MFNLSIFIYKILRCIDELHQIAEYTLFSQFLMSLIFIFSLLNILLKEVRREKFDIEDGNPK